MGWVGVDGWVGLFLDWAWRVHLESIVFQTLSVVTCILSLMVVWSEATLAASGLSPFAGLLDAVGSSGVEVGSCLGVWECLGLLYCV